jgi:feruloyl esterase
MAANTADASKACEALKGQMIGGARLVDTALVSPASGAGGDYCKVSGNIHGTLGFEIRMPAQWNQKLIYTGGGGFNGFIVPQTQSPSGNSGYALVASDGGHKGGPFDASWALNNPQAQQDYAYLSVHTVLQAANAIVEKHYRSAIERRYFEGCSNGGREALVAASRFPHDFDGIIARAGVGYHQNGSGIQPQPQAAARRGGWRAHRREPHNAGRRHYREVRYAGRSQGWRGEQSCGV